MGMLTKPQELKLDEMRRSNHDLSVTGVSGAGLLSISIPRTDGGFIVYTIGRGGELTLANGTSRVLRTHRSRICVGVAETYPQYRRCCDCGFCDECCRKRDAK